MHLYSQKCDDNAAARITKRSSLRIRFGRVYPIHSFTSAYPFCRYQPFASYNFCMKISSQKTVALQTIVKESCLHFNRIRNSIFSRKFDRKGVNSWVRFFLWLVLKCRETFSLVNLKNTRGSLVNFFFYFLCILCDPVFHKKKYQNDRWPFTVTKFKGEYRITCM